MSDTPIVVVNVDDDIIDARGVRRAFKKFKISNRLLFAGDGVEALDLLRGADGKPPVEGPLFILLDINMPRMGGLEFLQHLRADAKLCDATVMMFTTSNDPNDVAAAKANGAIDYLVKTEMGADFKGLIDAIKPFL